jgi:membrane protein
MARRFLDIVKSVYSDTVQRFSAADPVVYSAAIAFFTIFSMPSILFIIVRLGSVLIGPEKVRYEVERQVIDKIGTDAAEQVLSVIEAGYEWGDNLGAKLFSIFLLLFTATVVFAFVKKALNSIWNVKPKPKRGWLKFLIDRAISIFIIIFAGGIMVMGLVSEAMISFFQDRFTDNLFGLTPYVVDLLKFLISYLLVTCVFAFLFKYLPDIVSPWKPIWVGAFITGGLFSLGKFVIARIISSITITSAYGAASSLAAVLLWVFYSSITILLGAIFTKIYFLHLGHTVEPGSNAVGIEIKEIERVSKIPGYLNSKEVKS